MKYLLMVLMAVGPIGIAQGSHSCRAFFQGKNVRKVVKKSVHKAVVHRGHHLGHYGHGYDVYYQVGRGIRDEAIAEKAANKVAAKILAELQRLQSENDGVPQGALPLGVSAIAQQSCVKCHNSVKNEAGIILDGTKLLDYETFGRAVKAVAEESMPPTGPLSPEDKGKLLDELLLQIQE